jgi:hypothetical protein
MLVNRGVPVMGQPLSKKLEEFVNQQRNCYILEKDCIQWSYFFYRV